MLLVTRDKNHVDKFLFLVLFSQVRERFLAPKSHVRDRRPAVRAAALSDVALPMSAKLRLLRLVCLLLRQSLRGAAAWTH